MCRPQPQEVCARLAVPMSLFPGHHLYVKDHASHSLYILDEGGVGSCLAARFLSLRAPGGTAAKQRCCQRLELRCRNNPALWPGAWAGGWRLAHAAPQGRGARSFPPAGRMSASSGPGWSDAVFSGPAVLNLSGLFAAHVPKCAHHSQTVTAESGCHLWRVDCAMFERELLHRHTSILQELCQMQLQASLQRVSLQHVLPSCSHCPGFVQAGQLPLRGASLTPQKPATDSCAPSCPAADQGAAAVWQRLRLGHTRVVETGECRPGAAAGAGGRAGEAFGHPGGGSGAAAEAGTVACACMFERADLGRVVRAHMCIVAMVRPCLPSQPSILAVAHGTCQPHMQNLAAHVAYRRPPRSKQSRSRCWSMTRCSTHSRPAMRQWRRQRAQGVCRH